MGFLTYTRATSVEPPTTRACLRMHCAASVQPAELERTRSSAVAKRPCYASCLYSFNTKRRAQSFIIVVSASGIPLRTIKFFSVRFSSLRRIRPCCRPSQTNIRWCVADCAIYCILVGNCFCHFVVRTSSNRSIASGAWPTACVIYLASSLVNVFGTSHVQQSSIASY